MKKFNYEGVDKQGRTVTGSTLAENEQELKAQLANFGFRSVRVTADASSPKSGHRREPAAEQPPADLVQKLVDGDIEIGQPATEEEAEEYEWERAEALERIRRYRRRENVALVVTILLVVSAASYFIYDKVTEIPAPQPQIIMRSSSGMLSFKDVYVKGQDLVFVVYSRNWNGNVRVDFQAWDAFDNRIDFGTARLGFIGDHFGGSPEKSGTFRLKKYRFYERIEILVSGDEGK